TAGDGEPIAVVDVEDVEDAVEQDEPAPEPTDEPEPTNTPRPTATLPPEEALRAAILNALGTVNRDEVETIQEFVYDESTQEVLVIWAINDNFSENMIKRGAMMDVQDIMEQVSASGL